MRAARRRAAHQIWDVPKIFDDPLALRIVGDYHARALQHLKPLRETEISRSTRAFLAARSRFAEDSLAAAFARGVRQYVVLGAGLDTFACRNPHPLLRVFEVDRPATQSWKIAQLAATGMDASVRPVFVPVDFRRQDLSIELRGSGWKADVPSFFSCCGVSSYLPRDALMAMLTFVADCPRGSGVVFDVSTPATHVSPTERFVRRLIRLKLMFEGEPSISRYDPGDLSQALRRLGFGDVSSFDGAAINARYFEGRDDGLKVGNRSCLMLATV